MLESKNNLSEVIDETDNTKEGKEGKKVDIIQ